MAQIVPLCPRRAFTLVELTVVLAGIGVGVLLLIPALAGSKIDSAALRCLNNHRQLLLAWQMYAADSNDLLPAAQYGVVGRPIWMDGLLDFNGGNWSNYRTNVDIMLSPLWPYTAGKAEIFRCPSDTTYVSIAGKIYPRVRTVSMSQVFGTGEWLNGLGPGGPSGPYLVYASLSAIRVPSRTFVFADEHPGSINDAALAVSCGGTSPGDSPSLARIIDVPASFHNGGVAISFADGHGEIHKWIGRTIQPPVWGARPVPLAIPAGDSLVDIQWLAANTTVKK